MSSWPASAGPLLPDTGASTNMTSGRSSPSCPAIWVVGGDADRAHLRPHRPGANAAATLAVEDHRVHDIGGRQHRDHHAARP